MIGTQIQNIQLAPSQGKWLINFYIFFVDPAGVSVVNLYRYKHERSPHIAKRLVKASCENYKISSSRFAQLCTIFQHSHHTHVIVAKRAAPMLYASDLIYTRVS